MFAVIHRSEMIETQQLGQSASVDLVALVALSHGLVFSRIAHHQFRDVRFQQVVNQAAQVPSSKVTCNSTRSSSVNCRIMLAFVSMTHAITTLPAQFLTAIEI